MYNVTRGWHISWLMLCVPDTDMLKWVDILIMMPYFWSSTYGSTVQDAFVTSLKQFHQSSTVTSKVKLPIILGTFASLTVGTFVYSNPLIIIYTYHHINLGTDIYINRKTPHLKQEQRERGKLIEKVQQCFHANEL